MTLSEHPRHTFLAASLTQTLSHFPSAPLRSHREASRRRFVVRPRAPLRTIRPPPLTPRRSPTPKLPPGDTKPPRVAARPAQAAHLLPRPCTEPRDVLLLRSDDP